MKMRQQILDGAHRYVDSMNDESSYSFRIRVWRQKRREQRQMKREMELEDEDGPKRK